MSGGKVTGQAEVIDEVKAGCTVQVIKLKSKKKKRHIYVAIQYESATTYIFSHLFKCFWVEECGVGSILKQEWNQINHQCMPCMHVCILVCRIEKV